jgi:hypothetical protein
MSYQPDEAAALSLSIETQLDSLLEGISEVADRIGCERETVLIVCSNYGKKLHMWMQEHYDEIDAHRKAAS